jgi:hypothetical protein
MIMTTTEDQRSFAGIADVGEGSGTDKAPETPSAAGEGFVIPPRRPQDDDEAIEPTIVRGRE